MESKTGTINGTDNSAIFYRAWLPEHKEHIQAVIQIAHGMAEHSKRYEHFAEQCTAHNIAVYAHDHRGHGHTGSKDMLGHYGDHDGWAYALSDMNEVYKMIKQNHPDTPFISFGHSMGSFITQGFIFDYQPDIQGLILSGSNYSPPLKYKAALVLAKLEKLRKGPRYRSKLLDTVSFGSFNQRFTPNQTNFDWLSSDLTEVRKYIEDPHCGFVCTTQFWCDLLEGLIKISEDAAFTRLSPDTPLFIFSGQEDPVSNFGSGLMALSKQYSDAGVKDINLHLYPEARHEMLNEENRFEVGQHIISWIDTKLAGLTRD